jgi:cellulose synthase/poly-beta-1,6-N-acetylglucosamine synthase-like glycosyltransferase
MAVQGEDVVLLQTLGRLQQVRNNLSAAPNSAVASEPVRARVIIPAFKANRTIRQCVTAILNSRVSAELEIVVVDDGGHADLAGTLAGLPVMRAAVARNRGAKGFTGRYLIFIDADVLVDPSCLERLLTPLSAGDAEATVGNYSREVDELNFAGRYKQLYTARVYDRRRGYLRNEFWTAIGAIDAHIFYDLGGFETSFTGAAGEDTELGCRLSNRGCRILSIPNAFGRHLHSQTLRRIVLNDWRKGMATVRVYYLNGSSLSTYRHATLRDVAAVVLAFAAAGLFPVLLLTGMAPLLAACIGGGCAVAYVAMRSDIIDSFLSQGTLFVIRAVGVMVLLDYVRLACVGTSLWLRASKQLPRPRCGPNATSLVRRRASLGYGRSR